MAKKKTIINPEQGLRLKKLLQEERITQRDLSEEIEKHSYRTLSQQRISDIINGRAPLLFEVADVISNLPRFKDYDLLTKWLLCEEDYKNNTEKLLNAVAIADYEGNKLLQGLGCFLLLANYKIDISYPEKLSFDNASSIKNIVPDCFPTYTIKKDNQLIAELSNEEMIALGNKVFHLCEIYFQDHLK